MTVEIKEDDRHSIFLTDEDLDNDNFIDLGMKLEGEIVGSVSVDVDELIAAVGAFSRKREDRILREGRQA